MPKINKSDEEWKKELTPEQFRITRLKGTERAFSGQFYKNKEAGLYKCVCCGTPLFEADTKYDSGCGWPSFYDSTHKANIREEVDNSHGMMRTEVMCAACDAHLGHVFPDGPRPTGIRYCINSLSLDFEKDESEKK